MRGDSWAGFAAAHVDTSNLDSNPVWSHQFSTCKQGWREILVVVTNCCTRTLCNCWPQCEIAFRNCYFIFDKCLSVSLHVKSNEAFTYTLPMTHSIMYLTLHYCLCDNWLVGQHENIPADDKLHQNLSNPKGHYTQSPTVHWGRSPDDQMCTKHLYVFPVLTSDHHCLQLWGIVQCKVQESWNWWMLVGDAHVHKLYTIAVSRNKVQYELQWCTGIEWLNGLYHKQKSKHCHS